MRWQRNSAVSCVDNFGLVHHHNVDKALLRGGTSKTKSGGSRIESMQTTVDDMVYDKLARVDVIRQDPINGTFSVY